METLPRVATEMALRVSAYDLTQVMNILGIQPLLAAKHSHPDMRLVRRSAPPPRTRIAGKA